MKLVDKLDDQLKRATVPERPAGYWEYFPKRVVARLSEPGNATLAPWSLALRMGLASCAVIAIALLVFRFRDRPVPEAILADQRVPEMKQELRDPEKVYREMAALFPEQLAAIIADGSGVRVVLADRPGKQSSPPLFLKLCVRNGCQEIITFSGQQVRVNGDTCDVLLDGAGNVILAGNRTFWSSADRRSQSGRMRITAERLAL